MIKYIKDKKVIGLVSVLIIIFIISLVTYGKTKNKVFKDEYMKDIFVEVENDDSKEVSNEVLNVSTKPVEQEATIDKATIVVEIKGEVIKPDVYTLTSGSIIKDLIEMAGGLTAEADIANINRAQELTNHQLIIIGNVNNQAEAKSTANGVVSGLVNNVDDGLISINTATESELKEIPGVGDVKALAIIEYRESNGGFKSLDEMKNIEGIGEKTFDKMKDKIKL